MKINRLIITLCSLLVLAFSSCKKTEELPAPKSKILSYIVPLPSGDLQGVVDETDKTITVYIPLQAGLTFIQPQIKLSPGATINDTPKQISILDTQITYTVTGTDKSTTTYQLIIIVQQKTPLVVDELSTSDTAKVNIGSQVTLTGNFERNLFDEVQFSLVGPDGKETIFSKGSDYVSSELRADGKVYYTLYRQMPLDMKTGIYKAKVKFLKLNLEMKKPVQLVYGPPGWLLGEKIVEQGGTFQIDRSYSSVFVNFREFSIVVNGVKTLLNIQSYTLSQATIQIPETVPPGEYVPTGLFDGFPPKKGFSKIIVKEKSKN